MGFRDEYLWTNKTYAEWSLENTVESGFQGTQEKLQGLQRMVKSSFDGGIDRLVNEQISSAASIRSEIEFQSKALADKIEEGTSTVVSAIEDNTASVVGALQEMCSYLEAGLSEISWAIESQTIVSKDILKVLLESLDNQSRQYYEQGVKCYEVGEYELAKDRFIKALEANPTNYFACQYLGFINVISSNSDEACKMFSLATKFARTSYHKALSLSHLARSTYVIGDSEKAIDFAKQAVKSQPKTAKYWYELSVYLIQSQRTREGMAALKQAIELDWVFWSVCLTDSRLDPYISGVSELLDLLRNRERLIANKVTRCFQYAVKTLKEIGYNHPDLQKYDVCLNSINVRSAKDNVFFYKDTVSETIHLYNDVYSKIYIFLDTTLSFSTKSTTAQLITKQLYSNIEIIDPDLGKVLETLNSIEAVIPDLVTGNATDQQNLISSLFVNALNPYTKIDLQKVGRSLYVGRVDDQQLLKSGELILGIAANTTRDRLISRVPVVLKIADGDAIDAVVNNALMGVTLKYCPPPLGLINLEMLYFRLDRNAQDLALTRFWDRIIGLKTIAIYVPHGVPDEFPEAKLEMYAIKP